MARPRKTGLEYFPLDCILDTKVEMLRTAHGNDGFAVWIYLLQEIYQTENGELDCRDVLRRKTYAKRAELEPDTWELIVNTAAEVGLFDAEAWKEGVLTSNGVKKRIAEVSKKRENDRKRKGEEEEGFSDGKPEEKGGKGKGKGKGKDIPPNPPRGSGKDRPCDKDEVIALFRERGYSNPDVEGEKFWDFYTANGWKVGKNPMRDWRAAAANWARNIGTYGGSGGGGSGRGSGLTPPGYKPWTGLAEAKKLDQRMDEKTLWIENATTHVRAWRLRSEQIPIPDGWNQIHPRVTNGEQRTTA